MHRRMATVEQPAKVTALPTDHSVEARIERGRDAPDRAERHRSQLSALDPADARPGHAGSRGQIFLAPTLSNAHGAKRGPDVVIVHQGSVQ